MVDWGRRNDCQCPLRLPLSRGSVGGSILRTDVLPAVPPFQVISPRFPPQFLTRLPTP